jgi:NTP pyrophosphatase (non-canonical NTP hydrolase)
MTLENLEKLIGEWGNMKGILPNPDPMAQWKKSAEELEELHEAIRCNDLDLARDAIGDIFVTLVMQSNYWNLTMLECVQAAYDEIKDRTGKMVDGQFVKDVA